MTRSSDTPGRKALRQAYKQDAQVYAAPPVLTLSEWADQYRYLSPEDSAAAGRGAAEPAPYKREPMDACSDALVEDVVFMWSTQTGKTQSLLNVLGFYIHQDPAPILMLQPTIEMAQTVSKDRFAPMLRDTPVLRGKVKD